MPIPVILEVGAKRAFASAVDWPGWCRAGRDSERAIEALLQYAERYDQVARAAGLALPVLADSGLSVVERTPGDTTTDFGAPGAVAEADRTPVDAPTAERFAALLAASWSVFDATLASSPEELRKGPRGGGRDRDKMAAHVLGAEASYARMIGVRHRQPDLGDRAAIEALRADILAVLAVPSDGQPLREKGWPQRYAVRRITWHVLDHAWEMEDRSVPAV